MPRRFGDIARRVNSSRAPSDDPTLIEKSAYPN
jgi:hypothetical protein